MSKFQKLTSHIPSQYKPTVNKVWRAILESWGSGDDQVEAAIAQVKDQLFVETADGAYLDRLGSNVGIERPSAVGMDDKDFRNLIPTLSFAPKQVRDVIWKLLEVFYKSNAVFANFRTDAVEPYGLTDGDTISFTVDNKTTVTITFLASDFLDISQATALEVANSINKQVTSVGLLASEEFDGITSDTFVRVRTATPGPTGSIKIAGGVAQNVLKFPIVKENTQDIGTQWDVDITTGDTVRMEYTGVGAAPSINSLSTGDMVIISGPFNTNNDGSFIITDVVVNAPVDGITPGHKFTGNYIEFANVIAVPELITQINVLDVAFYTPKSFDVTSLPRPAITYEINHKEIVVILPASATIIGRKLTGSTHVHANNDNRVTFIDFPAGLIFRQGETVIGADSLYMAVGTGDFEEGETVIGATSLASAEIYRIVTNDPLNTIVAVRNTFGSFILGETITGVDSGASRNFVTLLNTVGATATVDAIIDNGQKHAWGNLVNSFLPGEIIIGRTAFQLSYSLNLFEEGEDVSTTNALHLVPPYIGDFTVGETITGAMSGAMTTLVETIRDKAVDKTVLEVGPIFGIFIPGEQVVGGTSGSFAILEKAITTNSPTAKISQIDSVSTMNTTGELIEQVGNFQSGEIIIGADSGAKAVLGTIESSLAVFNSTEVLDSYVSAYVYDELAEFSAASIAATTNQNINQGTLITTLAVNSIPNDWPNEPGYFILDFGRSNEEGPIRYISKPNNNTLIVDPAHLYEQNHVLGSDIRLISSLEPTTPRINGSDYATYITGLAEARQILQEFIRAVVAAGVVVRFIVIFPEYRFSCFNVNE